MTYWITTRARRFVAWGNDYFAMSWRWVPASPVIFLFAFIATVHVIFNPGEEIGFDIIAHWVYHLWIILGLGCPLLVLASWAMVRWGSGRMRYVGHWVRLGGDFGQATAIWAVVWLRVMYFAPFSDARLYEIIMLAGVGTWVGLLCVRDLWWLLLTETMAKHIHRRGGDDG